jgi:hypothetical protein
MNRIKKAAVSAKNFADAHKTAITILAVGTVTTALCAQLNKLSVETYNEFIEEQGMTDKFNEYLGVEE